MSLYEIIWFFFIYSFLGWVVEVIFAALNQGKFVNRGFLNGTVCPIYGFGVTLVVLILEPVKENFIVLYVASVIVTSVIELITGFLLEKIFHSRWWDYSKEHFNIGGYVCLRFSLLWGMACMIVVTNIHPLFERLVRHLHNGWSYAVFYILIVLMVVDLVDTIASILRIKNRLKSIDELAEKIHDFSDEVGSNIADGTLVIMEKVDLEKAREEYEKNRQKYQQLIEKKIHGSRLFKAFPDLKPEKHKEAFEAMKRQLENKQKNRKK